MNEYFEFEVSLKEVKPKIWRRFLLPRSATFFHLHHAIQDACGWTDSHLYSFYTPGRDREEIASSPDTDDFGLGEKASPSKKVKLTSYFEMYDKCVYVYDFGDAWEHEIKLKKVEQDVNKFKRKLLDGKRAFPLEDCGGIPGYFECADIVTGTIKITKDNIYIKDWIPKDWHPEKFNLVETQKNFDK